MENGKSKKVFTIDASRLWTGIIILIVGVVISQVIIASTWKATIDEKVASHIKRIDIHQNYENKAKMFITRKEFNAYKEQWDKTMDKIDEIYIQAMKQK